MIKSPDLRVVPIDKIRTNPVALREVKRDSEEYLRFAADIAKRGVINPISVTLQVDEATKDEFYQIVDGLHRYSGALDGDLEEVPVTVLDLDEVSRIETQIAMNLQKIHTNPVDYTKALQRMMNLEPTMTVQNLADRVNASPSFVMQRFSLLKLDAPIQKLVNDGEIKLANAFALAKLPVEHQHAWTDNAMTQQPSEFVPAVNQRAKEVKEAAKAGRATGAPTFVAAPRLRKLVDFKTEFEQRKIAPALCAEFNCSTAVEGFNLAIDWALRMDPHALAAAKAKFEANQKQKDEDAKKREAVRTAKKEAEAKEKAAKAREASGLSDEELAAALKAQAEAEVVEAPSEDSDEDSDE